MLCLPSQGEAYLISYTQMSHLVSLMCTSQAKDAEPTVRVHPEAAAGAPSPGNLPATAAAPASRLPAQASTGQQQCLTAAAFAAKCQVLVLFGRL